MRANRLDTVTLKIKINSVLIESLDRAVQSGLFGYNRPQCAERFIAEGLRRLIKEGVISTKPIDLNEEQNPKTP